MAKFVSKGDETVRLFRSPLLEALSHVSPLAPLAVYLPVIVACAVWSFAELDWPQALAGLAAGLFLWTLVEYWVHRVLFHYQPRSAWGQRLAFLLHGVHHDYPGDRTRLVLPLPVSLPLAALFYTAFRLLLGGYHLPVFTGFAAGYLAYDMLHYAIHHFPMKGRLARRLKKHHLRHHFSDPESGYGVSSPLWDYVFGTLAGGAAAPDDDDPAAAVAPPASAN